MSNASERASAIGPWIQAVPTEEENAMYKFLRFIVTAVVGGLVSWTLSENLTREVAAVLPDGSRIAEWLTDSLDEKGAVFWVQAAVWFLGLTMLARPLFDYVFGDGSRMQAASRLIRVGLGGILAWDIGPFLTVTIIEAFPDDWWTATWPDLSTPDTGAIWYRVQFCAWWILFTMLLGLVWAVLVKVLWTAQVFGDTKTARRVQGMVFALAGPATAGFVLTGMYRAMAGSQSMVFADSADFSQTGIGGVFETVRAQPAVPVIATAVFTLVFLIAKKPISRAYTRLVSLLEKSRFGYGGSSRFAGMFEEWGYAYHTQKYGLYLGHSLYNPIHDVGIEDERHMLTIAGNRSGKGASVSIPNLIQWAGSAIVIDPKGTNAAVTARARKYRGFDTHTIDPCGVIKSAVESARFNPLENIDPNDPASRGKIMTIADALVPPEPGSRDPHWDDGARSIIAGLIAQVCSTKGTAARLPMIRELLTQLPEQQAELWADMSLNPAFGNLAADVATRVIRGIKTNETLGLLSNADKHTEWLSDPLMKAVLTDPTCSFSDIKKKPTTIYFVIPPDKLAVYRRLLRLGVNLSIHAMSDGGKSKIPVLFMLDEFYSLGRMDEVQRAMGLMASYNMFIWPFVQDIGQLTQLYGKEGAKTFFANSRAVQMFGLNDADSQEFASKELGFRPPEQFIGKGSGRPSVALRDLTEVRRDVEPGSGVQYVLPKKGAPMLLGLTPYFKPTPRDTLHALLGWVPVLGRLFPAQFAGKFDPDPDHR